MSTPQDTWREVASLSAASERAAESGQAQLARDLEQQAEAMRRRLEKGQGR